MMLDSLNNLKGEYIFYKDGIEVARSENIVTNDGKEALISYLNRRDSEYASRIILGSGTSTPLATDQFLEFEVFPTSVYFRTLDFTQTPTQIVFRSTIPPTFKGVVRESGLSTLGGINLSDLNDVNDNNEIVATFDSDFEAWSISSGVAFHVNDLEGTPRLRVGDSGLEFTVPSTQTKTSTWSANAPLESYISSDKIKVAFHISGAVPSQISIKFSNDSLNFYTLPISSGMVVGYNILTFNVSQLVATGNPVIQNTESMTVTVTAAGSQSVVTMDAIRFDNYSSVEKPILVSRSVLSTPLVVEGGYPFDVEYRLGFSI